MSNPLFFQGEHTVFDRYHYRERTIDGLEGFQIRYGLSYEKGECVGFIHEEQHAMLICLLINQALEAHVEHTVPNN